MFYGQFFHIVRSVVTRRVRGVIPRLAGKLIVEIVAVLHGIDILIQRLGDQLLYVAQYAPSPPDLGRVAPPPLDDAAVVFLPSVGAEVRIMT